MIKLHEKYITDSDGKKSGVILSIQEYKKVLTILEEYEDIKDFDERLSDPQWLSMDEFKKKLDV